jgi:hypothetical protein
MDGNQFQHEMNAYRSSICDKAESLKDPQIITGRLKTFYKRISPDQRPLADQILCEWALSDDEAPRFNALALIDEFQVIGALSSLQDLETRLTAQQGPDIPYELKKIGRIVDRLRC